MLTSDRRQSCEDDDVVASWWKRGEGDRRPVDLDRYASELEGAATWFTSTSVVSPGSLPKTGGGLFPDPQPARSTQRTRSK